MLSPLQPGHRSTIVASTRLLPSRWRLEMMHARGKRGVRTLDGDVLIAVGAAVVLRRRQRDEVLPVLVGGATGAVTAVRLVPCRWRE